MTTTDAPATHPLILNDHEPLAWVLENQRRAFPAGRAQQSLSLGKETRSCCTPHGVAS